ncbi:MAG: lytic murein transglycosylase, partial [Magnetococcus sp. YQC-3]
MVDSTFQDEPSRPREQGRKDASRLHQRLLWGWLVAVFLLIAWNGHALAAQESPTAEQEWLAEWVNRGEFERAWLDTLLAPLTPDPRVLRLMDRQAEAKPYYLYRKNFINEQRIQRGRALLREHRTLLQRIRQQFDVPPEIVVTLWGVESDFGRSAGDLSVLRTLYTLAAHYPRRAPFFREELRHFLLLCREEGWDPHEPEGSYAGAFGQMQMMPSTLRTYGVDFNNDGKRDVFNDTGDILASIASFLARHGWKPDGIMSIQLNKKGNPDLSTLVSPSLNAMRPWQEWQEMGILLGAQDENPDPNE